MTDPQQVNEKFDEWCILEILGHRRLAGKVSETTIGGGTFIRVDIPGADGGPGFTQFYSLSAIYCISPSTEQMCRQLAKQFTEAPISRFEIQALPDNSGGGNSAYSKAAIIRDQHNDDVDDELPF